MHFFPGVVLVVKFEERFSFGTQRRRKAVSAFVNSRVKIETVLHTFAIYWKSLILIY